MTGEPSRYLPPPPIPSPHQFLPAHDSKTCVFMGKYAQSPGKLSHRAHWPVVRLPANVTDGDLMHALPSSLLYPTSAHEHGHLLANFREEFSWRASPECHLLRECERIVFLASTLS